MKREKYQRNRSINLMRNPLRELKVTSLIKVEVQVKIKVSAEKKFKNKCDCCECNGFKSGSTANICN